MEWFPIGWFRNAFHLSVLLFAGPIYINFRLMLLVLTTQPLFSSKRTWILFIQAKHTFSRYVIWIHSRSCIHCRYLRNIEMISNVDLSKPQRKHKLHSEIDKIISTSVSNKNNPNLRPRPIANTQYIIVVLNELFATYVHSLYASKHGSVPGF